MGRFVWIGIASVALGIVLSSALKVWSAPSSNTAKVTTSDQVVLDADRSFQQAIGKGKRKAPMALLDTSFAGTDSAGYSGEGEGLA